MWESEKSAIFFHWWQNIVQAETKHLSQLTSLPFVGASETLSANWDYLPLNLTNIHGIIFRVSWTSANEQTTRTALINLNTVHVLGCVTQPVLWLTGWIHSQLWTWIHYKAVGFTGNLSGRQIVSKSRFGCNIFQKQSIPYCSPPEYPFNSSMEAFKQNQQLWNIDEHWPFIDDLRMSTNSHVP